MANNNHDGKPLIIIGCHRSGTSLLSSALEARGCFLGAKLNNHFEAAFLLNLNVSIFDFAEGKWDQPIVVSSKLGDKEFYVRSRNWLHRQMGSLKFFRDYWGLKNYLSFRVKRFPLWGWKDPRNTVTLPLWLDLFPQAKVIHICRNGIDVAQSLRVRELRRRSRNPLISQKCRDLDGAFSVWAEYEQIALENSRYLNPTQYIRIRYEDMLLYPEREFDKLSEFVDCNLREVAKLNPDPRRAYAFNREKELRSFFERKQLNSLMIAYGYDQIENSFS